MGTYEELKAAIQQVIRTNGNNEITGALLQNALLSIVNVVGANATFAGIATPNTNPGTADQNVFYLATEAGTYVNFGGIEINMGEAVILSNKTGNWVKTTSGFATQQQLTEFESDILSLIGLHKEGVASFTATGIKTVIEDIYIPKGQEYQVTIGGTVNWSSLYLFDQKAFAESDNAKNIPSAGTYTFAAKVNEITKLQLFLVDATSFGDITVSVNIGGELDSKVNVSDFEDYEKQTKETNFNQSMRDGVMLARSVERINEISVKDNSPMQGFYNLYGQFTESELFVYQMVEIDHKKCYHIINDNEEFGISVLVLFDINGNPLSVEQNRMVDDYFVFPETVKKFAVSRYINTWGKVGILTYDVAKERSSQKSVLANGFRNAVATVLNEGEYIHVDTPDAMKNKTISFHAEVATMGSITLKHMASKSYGNSIIKVDATNVYFYPSVGDSNTPNVTTPHGLNIRSFISILIDVKEWWEGRITITTLGGEYTTTFSSMLESRGGITAIANSGRFTNALVGFGCVDLTKNVWMFGDSYFTMWPYYALNKKHSNCYLDGWAGRKSADALTSLQKALTFGYVPKTIVWFMGMNDPDTNSSVNASWKSCYDSLVEICSAYSIELVLTTIPVTPTMNNSHKNAVVKNSGYRYIDINEAVGGSSSGWYSGLLSSDNVHPTNTYSTDGLNGCVVIAARVMADLPEIMNP